MELLLSSVLQWCAGVLALTAPALVERAVPQRADEQLGTITKLLTDRQFCRPFKLRGELQEVVERVVRARGHGVVVRAIHRDGVRRSARASDDAAAPVAARGGELRDEGAVDTAEESRAPVLAGSEDVVGRVDRERFDEDTVGPDRQREGGR